MSSQAKDKQREVKGEQEREKVRLENRKRGRVRRTDPKVD